MEEKQVKLLDFEKNPVEVLTLEELEQTHKENYPDGTPVGDIYHFVLMQQIIRMCEEAGLNPEIKEVFAVNNKHKRSPGVTILPQVSEELGVGSLASHILRRVFCNINLRGDFTNDQRTYNIAVSYTQLGICVGFGPFTYACHNQTICRADAIVSNYTVRGFARLESKDRAIATFMESLKRQIASVSDLALHDNQMVDELKEKRFSPSQIHRLVGELCYERVLCESNTDESVKKGIPPLDSARINAFVKRLTDESAYQLGCTGYDMLMAGNEHFKPGIIPFENIAPQSLALFEKIHNFA